MLARARELAAKTVIVESPDRFAGDLMVQLTGHDLLKRRGITLIAASAPSHFTDDTPTARLVRAALGAISEFEKSMLVDRLRGARERTGHLGGRPKVSASQPEAARRAKELTGSLRSIARVLALEGFVSSTGRPFTPKTIAAMRSSAA